MNLKKNKRNRLYFPCSQERADKEGLYFPRRRVRIRGIDKSHIYSKIEDQDFKDATEQEIEDCYRELARQIKIFKKRYIKLESLIHLNQAEGEDASLSLYESAHKIIGKSCQPSDPSDHKDLLKNLCKVVAEGRLLPGSGDFNFICNFVRELMPMKTIREVFRINVQDTEQINLDTKERKESNVAQEDENKIKFKFLSTLCNQDQIKNEQIKSLNKICSLFHSN